MAGLRRLGGTAQKWGEAGHMQRGTSLGAVDGTHVAQRRDGERRRAARPILRAQSTRPSVLVVDDNPATRRFVRETLEVEGFDVLEADGGAAAIEMCDEALPDLVIIDLCMGDMRGSDVVRRLRQRGSAEHLPIVVFTGAPEEAADEVEARYDDLLAKPVDAADLVDTVRSLLAGSPAASPGPAPAVASRILLVDADSGRSLRVRLHLRRIGFEVMLVTTAAQALRSARSFRPALVVTDLVLPDSTALELTRALREEIALGDVPVVLTSTAPWSEVQQRLAERAGANAFVTLTADLAGLRDAVTSVAGRPVPAAEPAQTDERDEHADHLLRELHEQYRRQVDGNRTRQRGAAELTVLQGLAEALGDTADLDSVLQNGLAHCLHAIGASRGAVFLGEIDGSFSMRAHLGDLGRLPGAHIRAGEELFHRVMTTGETLVVDGEPSDVEAGLDAAGRPSTVVAPVAAHPDEFGVIVAEVPAHEDLGYWMQFLKLVGLALGLAVANARRSAAGRPAAPATGGSPIDELTGLATAPAFEDAVTAAVQHPSPGGAVMVLDVDRIRHVNDALGHETGDELLRGLARVLRSVARSRATVARLHSDVFALVDPDVHTVDEALVLARQVHAVLESPLRCHGYTLYATASVGIALFPEHGNRAGTLLQHATTALDVAKERGGNAVEVYSQHRSDSLWQRLTVDQGLRAALERDQFELHYQPIVDLATGSVSAAEALLRWDRPLHGLTVAANFIQVAEETGLIVPIGAWVIRNAARQAHDWATAGLDLQRLALNVGAREFHHGQIYDTVVRALDETGVDPGRLSLEVTETVALEDIEHAVQTLHRIRALGVHVALDDFGAGYSSLRYIQELPIDTLKIDRSFVADAARNERSEPILAGIVDLAHKLGMTVVAEGIETPACLEMVTALGCDEAQGYHLGRPGTADDLEAHLRT